MNITYSRINNTEKKKKEKSFREEECRNKIRQENKVMVSDQLRNHSNSKDSRSSRHLIVFVNN